MTTVSDKLAKTVAADPFHDDSTARIAADLSNLVVYVLGRDERGHATREKARYGDLDVSVAARGTVRRQMHEKTRLLYSPGFRRQADALIEGMQAD